MNVNDNINLECEARVMITENQYSQIKKTYLESGFKFKKIFNENVYFDYENRYLTDHGIVLRLRKINNRNNELTLKIKGENSDLEINHELTSKEVDLLLKNTIIPNSFVLDELKKKQIDLSKLKIVATLVTERIEIQYPEYLFVLDKNIYNNKTDFNLEVESDTKINAENNLKSIISQFGIEYKKDYISKSRRAIYNL